MTTAIITQAEYVLSSIENKNADYSTIKLI